MGIFTDFMIFLCVLQLRIQDERRQNVCEMHRRFQDLSNAGKIKHRTWSLYYLKIVSGHCHDSRKRDLYRADIQPNTLSVIMVCYIVIGCAYLSSKTTFCDEVVSGKTGFHTNPDANNTANAKDIAQEISHNRHHTSKELKGDKKKVLLNSPKKRRHRPKAKSMVGVKTDSQTTTQSTNKLQNEGTGNTHTTDLYIPLHTASTSTSDTHSDNEGPQSRVVHTHNDKGSPREMTTDTLHLKNQESSNNAMTVRRHPGFASPHVIEMRPSEFAKRNVELWQKTIATSYAQQCRESLANRVPKAQSNDPATSSLIEKRCKAAYDQAKEGVRLWQKTNGEVPLMQIRDLILDTNEMEFDRAMDEQLLHRRLGIEAKG